jgi:hypothetical protein
LTGRKPKSVNHDGTINEVTNSVKRTTDLSKKKGEKRIKYDVHQTLKFQPQLLHVRTISTKCKAPTQNPLWTLTAKGPPVIFKFTNYI